MPRGLDEIAQLQKVVEFKESLAKLGLTWEYSSSAEFPNIFRPHLARIILDTPSVTNEKAALEIPSTPHAPIDVTVHESISIGDSVEASVTRRKPSIFISSSSEDLKTVRELSSLLEVFGINVIRWDQSGFSAGRTIMEAFESTLSKVDAAIVLLGEGSPPSNLIYELGMLQGRLGRTRTVVLSLGNSILPSDILGTIYLRYSKEDVKAIMPNLQRELQHMGLIDAEKR